MREAGELPGELDQGGGSSMCKCCDLANDHDRTAVLGTVAGVDWRNTSALVLRPASVPLRSI